MSDIAIRVENLSKRYRIGQGAKARYDTLYDKLAGVVRTPWRLFRGNGHTQEEYIWALKDVSFEVKRGEVVGIIGRNGAGKSTLLKILSRITEPTSGRAEVYGRVGSLLEVGTGFHPELTGRENIYLNGAILGMKKAEIDRKLDEIVAFAELEKFIDTPVKFYSSGMYVRLAFAVAAHLEPEILLVDEVLAVGDAAFQKKCLGKMEDVAQEGRTVLFVSHNMTMIQYLCGRVFWIDKGQVLGDGKTSEIIEKYILTYLQQNVNGYCYCSKVNKHIELTSISITGKAPNRKYTTPGSDLSITARIRPLSERVYINIDYIIKDSSGRNISLVSSFFSGMHGFMIDKMTSITVHIRNINLLPGRYYIDAYVFANKEKAIMVESAAYFDVLIDDIYGTGRVPDTRYGCVYFPHNWYIDDTSNHGEDQEGK